MSFILDALKKSESDRQRQSGPALFEVRVASPKTQLPLWALAVGALLLINIVIVGWLLSRRSAHAESAAVPAATPGGFVAAPAPAAAAPAPAAPAAAAPAPPVSQPYDTRAASYGAQSGSGEPTLTAGNMARVAPAPRAPAPTALPTVAATAAPTAAPTAGPTAGPTTGPTAAATAGPAPVTTSAPLSASDDRGAPDTANPDDYAPAKEGGSGPLFKSHVKRSTDGGYTLYQDAAVAPGANLPQLRLDLHVYAARPEDRFALINMHRVHEGDALPEGVRVESINQEGVVLSHNGSRFLLPRD